MKAVEPNEEQQKYLSNRHNDVVQNPNELAYRMSRDFDIRYSTAAAMVRQYRAVNLRTIIDDYVIPESEIIPSHKLTWRLEELEHVDPVRVEHIPDTTKVIVTYPSRV
jgi:hypothetical protein